MDYTLGIVTGVLLSALSAWLVFKLNRSYQHKTILRFCADIVTNIDEVVGALSDKRDKDDLIDEEFLELINAEIAIFGRNREHLVAVDDEHLRREIRDYITRVASHVARVRAHLRRFYEHYVPGDVSQYPHPQQAMRSQEIAAVALSGAKETCDSLKHDVSTKGASLIGKLKAK